MEDYLEPTMTGMRVLLEEYLGTPISIEQENMMQFFQFFLLIFIISCIFDLITNITKL